MFETSISGWRRHTVLNISYCLQSFWFVFCLFEKLRFFPSVFFLQVVVAEMLSVLVSALEVMDREASPLGMTINWAKTKLQNLGDMDGANQTQHSTVL